MSKVNKIKAIIIMLLASVMMFAASAFFMNANEVKTVSAEEEKVFVMSDEIQARISTPAGLRFRAYLDQTVMDELKDASAFGFIIAPSVNFRPETPDYLAEGAMTDKVIVPVDKAKLSTVAEDDKYYAQGARYFVNAVLYNILEENWDLDFSAVAYYTVNGVNHFTKNDKIPSANIGDILNEQFFNPQGNSETRNQLYKYFNFGGEEDKVISAEEAGNYGLDSYTIPAHPIKVNQSNFSFIASLPYAGHAQTAGGDAGYAYKLTENITLSTPSLDSNSSFTKDTVFFDNDFAGILDADGHKITFNQHSAKGVCWGFFGMISGTIKNATLVLNYATTFSGSNYGILANELYGAIENCVISLNAKHLGSYGYPALFRYMYGDAGINNTIISVIGDQYISGSVITSGHNDSTIKLENVAFVSNRLGWVGSGTGYFLGKALPNNKCIIDNYYIYGGISDAVKGSASYVLNEDKYNAEGAPANITYASGNSSNENVAVLYDGATTMALKDLVGYDVISASHDILTALDTHGTVAGLDFAAPASRTTISLDKNSLELTAGQENGQLTATVLIDGVAVSSPALVWSSDATNVAMVNNGVVTPVGPGKATITVTYFGLTATCEVSVKEFWYEIGDGVEFFNTIQSNSGANIKLTQDIVIKNKAIDGGISAFGDVISSEFNGVIDGQGYTMTVIMANVNSYPAGLITTLNGTLKNINVILTRDDYGNASAQSGFVTNLNGTIENAVISTHYNRYGTTWKIDWSFVRNMGANAVIKNTVLYADGAYSNSIYSMQAGSTVENFAFIDSGASSRHSTFATTGILDDVYFFVSPANFLAGSVSHKYDVASGAFVSSSETIDIANIFGVEYTAIKVVVAGEVREVATDITFDTVTPVNETFKQKVSVELQETLELNQKSPATQLNAVVTFDGQPVDASALVWSCDDERVVTIDNGVVTVVGAGTATVTLTYFGVSKSCVVTVNEYWEEINSTEEFITAMATAPNLSYILNTDIELICNNLTNDELGVVGNYTDGAYVFNINFTGKINGNKHTIFVSNAYINSTFSGVFNTITGTISNTNFIILNRTYYRGSRYGILATTLNGTIENCIINHSNLNNGGGYGYPSMIHEMGADAEIKNTVFNRLEHGYYNSKTVGAPAASSKLTNVVSISTNLGWASPASISSQIVGMLPKSKCDVNGFWVSGSIADAVGGKAYALNAEKYADPSTPADVSIETGKTTIGDAQIQVLYNQYGACFNFVEVFGYSITTKTATLACGSYANSAFTTVLTEFTNIADFVK